MGFGFRHICLVHQINIYSILNFPEAMCKIRVNENLVNARENLREMMEMGMISVPTSAGPPRPMTTITIPTTSPGLTASATATKSGTEDEKPTGSWQTPEEWQLLKNLILTFVLTLYYLFGVVLF